MGSAGVSGRLWYPQLDVFDTVRRIGALLERFAVSPGTERLYIADFFLANPPLLHRTTMPLNTRRAFNALKIPRPEKTFLSYPSAPLLFHKMEAIQREAVTALTGKGLVSIGAVQHGKVELTERGHTLFTTNSISSDAEAAVTDFIATDFAAGEAVGNHDLRRRTGLRRPV